MLHLFLIPSPLLAAGEVLVGIFTLPMFVAALIAAYGDRIRLSGGGWARGGRCTPHPATGPPRGSYPVPAPQIVPTSARSTVGIGQELRPAFVMEDLINDQAHAF